MPAQSHGPYAVHCFHPYKAEVEEVWEALVPSSVTHWVRFELDSITLPVGAMTSCGKKPLANTPFISLPKNGQWKLQEPESQSQAALLLQLILCSCSWLFAVDSLPCRSYGLHRNKPAPDISFSAWAMLEGRSSVDSENRLLLEITCLSSLVHALWTWETCLRLDTTYGGAVWNIR